MTNAEDAILKLLEQEFRPEGATVTAEVTPRTYDRVRKLAAKWDTHPINVLSRALELAELLQSADQQGAEITVRWPMCWRHRLRGYRRDYKIKAARKGPEN